MFCSEGKSKGKGRTIKGISSPPFFEAVCLKESVELTMKRKMKKICLWLSCLYFVLICGCGQANKLDMEKIARGELSLFSESELDKLYETEFEFDQPNILQEYSTSEIETCDGKNIGGILCREDDILMVDTTNDCILVFNKNMEIIDKIGETGNGMLEFLNPTGIAEHNGDIYVLDAENRRVQVLNADFTYKTEICFHENIEKKAKYVNNIAVDEFGNIYLSSTNYEFSKILCFNTQEEQFVELGQNFCGTVAEKDGKIYAANIGVMIGERNEIIGWRTGLNVFYSVTAEGLEMICEFPYGSTIFGLIVEEDEIICVSGAYVMVNCYDFNGAYKYSYAHNEEFIMQSNIAMDESGTIYVALPNKEKVMKIEKVEK